MLRQMPAQLLAEWLAAYQLDDEPGDTAKPTTPDDAYQALLNYGK